MWPFNSSQVDQTGMPAEVHQYIQAERREKVGVAWLLAGVTLVVTLVVAVGLFYGGRYGYRKYVASKNKKQVVEVAQNQSSVSADNTQKQTATNTATNKSNSDGKVSDQAAVTTNPSPVSSSSSSTPAPVPTPAPLPNTGPDGND
jgi:cytoskeletal protein RodZ